ncbi:hypothetical protein AAU61_05755 [Desulfocarbo indianensis]|nr:hypothetical protein AAU61_05755 [Desulfocarbo indianensis]
MKTKTAAITLGTILALAGGFYLGSGVQAGNCDIGGDVGPGVKITLAENQTKDTEKKPCPNTKEDKGKDDSQKAEGQDAKKPSPPVIPRIAPDEGC